jgi:hypothetical protein
MRCVLISTRAVEAGFVFTRLRLLRDIHAAVKALVQLGASDLRNADRRHANAQ